MRDLEGTTCRLKGERDRLKEENQKLAADVGEEPMLCADTEDSDALVEQIKGLKGENDRLREMQQSNRSKRNRRKKKKRFMHITMPLGTRRANGACTLQLTPAFIKTITCEQDMYITIHTSAKNEYWSN